MANRFRENKLYFYLSDDELRRLNKRTAELGVQNRSNYIRKMILDGYCVQLDLQEVREMVSLLRRMSNNLNQYARMANATGSIYEKDIQDIQNKQEELWLMMKKILQEIAGVQ